MHMDVYVYVYDDFHIKMTLKAFYSFYMTIPLKIKMSSTCNISLIAASDQLPGLNFFTFYVLSLQFDL